uniref:Uncharacterized protein n=1 Tax=Glossina pallidipes TaxID=7398 RepID=A0A1A9ZV84_GLOPL
MNALPRVHLGAVQVVQQKAVQLQVAQQEAVQLQVAQQEAVQLQVAQQEAVPHLAEKDVVQIQVAQQEAAPHLAEKEVVQIQVAQLHLVEKEVVQIQVAQLQMAEREMAEIEVTEMQVAQQAQLEGSLILLAETVLAAEAIKPQARSRAAKINLMTNKRKRKHFRKMCVLYLARPTAVHCSGATNLINFLKDGSFAGYVWLLDLVE